MNVPVFGHKTGDHRPHLWADGAAQIKELLGIDLAMPAPQEENTSCHSFDGNKEEIIEVDRREKNNRFCIMIITSE